MEWQLCVTNKAQRAGRNRSADGSPPPPLDGRAIQSNPIQMLEWRGSAGEGRRGEEDARLCASSAWLGSEGEEKRGAHPQSASEGAGNNTREYPSLPPCRWLPGGLGPKKKKKTHSPY